MDAVRDFGRRVYALSKYIFRYKKEGIAKYISHLDFLRAINRAFRRAEIKVAHSQGFNPHPLLSFALPLALGITSECEAFEAALEETTQSEEEILTKLNSVLPDGIVITSVTKNDYGNWFSEIQKALYKICPENMPTEDQISKFMAIEEIIMDKKTKKGIKPVNIKQDIYEIKLDEEYIYMLLSAGNDKNIKPMLVVDAFNKYIDEYNAGFCTYHRCNILDKNNRAL